MLRRLRGCICFLSKIEMLHNKYDLMNNNMNKLWNFGLF